MCSTGGTPCASFGHMIDDPEIAAIGKAQRNQKLKRLGIVVAVLVVAAVAIMPSGGSVASALEADGYSDVTVSRKGVFSFTYKAKKGAADCSGSVTKMPGSSSRSGSCFTTSD